MAYIYQGDIYCRACGGKIELTCSENGVYPSEDSEEWPQDIGEPGESDCPQHCGTCGEFLENPLTDDGWDYLYGRIVAALAKGDAAEVNEHLSHYAVTIRDIVDYLKRKGNNDK